MADVALNALDRIPPHDEEAERAVIGACLLNHRVLDEVTDIIRSDDFYTSHFRIAFESILSLYDRGQPIDSVLLRNYLESTGKLESIDFQQVVDATSSVPSIANADYYANIVREKALLRELINVSSDVLKNTFESSSNPREVLDLAESRIFDVAQRNYKNAGSSIRDILQETVKRIEDNLKRGGGLTGLDTGYFALNEQTNGIQPSDLIIIAGRPSMGKTTFALNLMDHFALNGEKPVAVALFSLEMGKEQIAENMLCAHARIDSEELKKGRLTEKKWNDLMMAAGSLSEAPIYIDDSPGLSPLEIRAKARRLKSRYDIQAIFIDYIQLMQDSARSREGRQQEISSISRSLKALARELHLPVIVLSQLNRSVEQRENHKPRMSDLRESGAIEQDADVIMLVHRDDYYDPEKNPGSVFINIAKQRNGPVGEIELFFAKEHKRFENLSRRQ